MDTLPVPPIVNPATVANPRDSWPSWTGEDRSGTRPRGHRRIWRRRRDPVGDGRVDRGPGRHAPADRPDVAERLARKLDGIASECRFLDVEPPDELVARAEVWAGRSRDTGACDGEGGGISNPPLPSDDDTVPLYAPGVWGPDEPMARRIWMTRRLLRSAVRRFQQALAFARAVDAAMPEPFRPQYGPDAGPNAAAQAEGECRMWWACCRMRTPTSTRRSGAGQADLQPL